MAVQQCSEMVPENDQELIFFSERFSQTVNRRQGLEGAPYEHFQSCMK